MCNFSLFCNFLSVLLDVIFYEPTSKFMNFITTKYLNTQKCYSHERFRTAFYDPELELYIKDNMNGLCPKKEVEKGNFMNGYFSISPNNGSQLFQTKTGNIESIENAFGGVVQRAKERLSQVSQTITERQAKRDKIGRFVSTLEKLDGPLTAFNEDDWYSLVEYATVYSREDIRFTFKNGMEIKA